MLRHFLLFLLIFVLTGCGLAADGSGPDPILITPVAEPVVSGEMDTLLPFQEIPVEGWAELPSAQMQEQIFAALMRRDPQFAAELGVSELFGIPDNQLTNLSDAYLRETDALVGQYLELLRQADTADLTPQQQLSHDIMMWDLETRVLGQAFAYHDYPVNQVFGVQNDLPVFMATIHPLDNSADADAFLSRLGQVGTQLGQLQEGLALRAEKGIIPPRFVFQRVLAEMRSFVATPARDNIIHIGFQARLAEAAGLSQSERRSYSDTVVEAIESDVYPAYRRLIDYLEELEKEADDDDGVWKLPDGEAYYAFRLRQQTTTDLPPEAIHQLGLQEVERIQGEMRELLARHDLSTDLSRGIGQVYQGAGGYTVQSDADRAAVITAYQEAMIVADAAMGHMFALRPETPLEIQRVPAFREGTGPGAFYSSPPLDGSRNGVFYVNLPDGRFVSNVDIPTLAYHEGIPGHHLQRALQREQSHLPLFRRTSHFNAFAEGWALYAERLAWEVGLYDGDLYGDWGRLQAELFRAARLVVDTGIHDQGWTREEAISYMTQTLNWSPDNVTGEVERYIVWPGQATGYKIGQLTMLRLRQEAQEALGDRFDLSEFHTVLLSNGDVPLEILETIVEEYIAEKR